MRLYPRKFLQRIAHFHQGLGCKPNSLIDQKSHKDEALPCKMVGLKTLIRTKSSTRSTGTLQPTFLAPPASVQASQLVHATGRNSPWWSRFFYFLCILFDTSVDPIK
jgi:hypothetical protein